MKSHSDGFIRSVEQELTARGDDKNSVVYELIPNFNFNYSLSFLSFLFCSSGSSYSFAQLKSMKRSDVLRYRKYKYLTENSRFAFINHLLLM